MSKANKTINRTNATQRKAAARQAKRRREERFALAAAIAAALIAVCFILVSLASKGLYAGWTTAATVGPYKVSTAVYNCYYGKAAQELSALFSMGGGTAPTGEAWREAVLEQADAAVQSDYAVCAAAEAAGWSLSAEDQAAVDEEISTIEHMAQSDGYPDADHYLADTLGAGCDLESYRSYVEHVQMAQSYRDAYYANLSFDQTEIETAYAASPETFDLVSFRSFYLESTDEAQARQAAAAVTDEASFAAMARQYAPAEDQADYVDDDATLEHMLVSRLNADNRAWLTDSSRAYGDVGVVPYRDAGYFILFYIGLNQDMQARDQAVEEHLRDQTFEQWTQELTQTSPLHRHWLGMAGVAR